MHISIVTLLLLSLDYIIIIINDPVVVVLFFLFVPLLFLYRNIFFYIYIHIYICQYPEITSVWNHRFILFYFHKFFLFFSFSFPLNHQIKPLLFHCLVVLGKTSIEWHRNANWSCFNCLLKSIFQSKNYRFVSLIFDWIFDLIQFVCFVNKVLTLIRLSWRLSC